MSSRKIGFLSVLKSLHNASFPVFNHYTSMGLTKADYSTIAHGMHKYTHTSLNHKLYCNT